MWRPWLSWLPGFRVARPVGVGSWAWLEPYPGPPHGAGPRSLSIDFVAALQRLPPDQRAALLLSDVLDFGIAEVAEILDCDIAEVGHLLLSARSAICATRPCRPPGGPPAPAETPGPGGAAADPVPAKHEAKHEDEDEDEVVARFAGAFERGDMAGIAALLTRDVWLRMRPLPVAYRGRGAARHFLAAVAFPGGTPGYRLVATRANGQPAFGCYLRDPVGGVDRACGLVVLTVDGGSIAAIDRFVDNSMLPRFGLPRTLPRER